MTEEPKTTEQSPKPEGPTAEAWRDVGTQFEALGKNLAAAARAAWEDETNRRSLAQMQAGLEQMADDVDKAIKSAAAAVEDEKVKAAAKEAAAKATPKAEPPPPPTPVRRAMTSQDLQQMRMNITDARRGDDLDHRALIGLHKLRKDNEEKGIENPPELLEFLKEFPSVPTPAEGGGSSEEKASSDSGGSDPSKEPSASESSEESTEEIK